MNNELTCPLSQRTIRPSTRKQNKVLSITDCNPIHQSGLQMIFIIFPTSNPSEEQEIDYYVYVSKSPSEEQAIACYVCL
jgi:hypothetical protein